MRDPIYEPRGAAREYAELALNVYEGCTHQCAYCYAPAVMRKARVDFAKCRYRGGLVQALERQLSRGGLEGRTVHLCFSCDPYPRDVDTSPTREVIRLLKDAGCHVQILTKNPVAARLDFDLLDSRDMFGVSITGASASVEPNSSTHSQRIDALIHAHSMGIGTWVSCEPIIDPKPIYRLIAIGDFVDRFKFGKLNYVECDMDWAAIGRNVEMLCEMHGREYVIKESLRAEMRRAAP